MRATDPEVTILQNCESTTDTTELQQQLQPDSIVAAVAIEDW